MHAYLDLRRPTVADVISILFLRAQLSEPTSVGQFDLIIAFNLTSPIAHTIRPAHLGIQISLIFICLCLTTRIEEKESTSGR